MQIEIGKRYKIIGEVSAAHGDCKGDIITCTSIDEDQDVTFDNLYWSSSVERGEYYLCPPRNLRGDEYCKWLETVLEEV